MRLLRLAEAALVAVLVADWLAFKRGWLPQHPQSFAAVVAGLVALLLIDVVGTTLRVVTGRERPGLGGGRIVLLTGLITVAGGGLGNWLLGLQGFVILHELEAVPLPGGGHLQQLELGPLARRHELDLVLQLEKLELRPEDGGFVPASRLRVERPDGTIETFTVRPEASVRCGPLWFHQGAFGFAPRIVILDGQRTAFDQAVPFTTVSHGLGRVSFEGEFTIGREDMRVAGVVDLSSLDEAMRGHATLRLRLERGGESLGEGNLLPGHFAEVGEGWRVGFAGLERWSEIDVSRRSYPHVVLGGAGTAVIGAVWWVVAAWRVRWGRS